MALQYEHTTRPDPDGLRPAPRTLRDMERDPFDWIERPAAANSPQLAEGDARDPRVMHPHTLRLALLIALATLLGAGAIVLAILRLN